jgi:hypothetical protein
MKSRVALLAVIPAAADFVAAGRGVAATPPSTQCAPAARFSGRDVARFVLEHRGPMRNSAPVRSGDRLALSERDHRVGASALGGPV